MSHPSSSQSDAAKKQDIPPASEHLSIIFQASPMPIALTRMDGGQLVEVNPAWLELTGYTRDQCIGKTALDLDLYVSSEARSQLVMELQKRGHISDFEFQIRAKNGELRDVLLSAEMVEMHSGTAMLSMAIDITERKLIEEELSKSESRYRQIFETANEGIWTMDRDHRTTFVNEHMLNMLGYQIEDMLGKRVEDFMFEEDLPAHEERMAQRHKKISGNYDHRFRRGDGTTLWTLVSATVLTNEDGDFDGSFGMFTDITERKQAEDALRKASDTAEQYLNVSAELIISLDTQGTITLMNDNGHRLLGYNPEELIGKNWFETCIPDNLRSEIRAVFQKLMSGDMENVAIYENTVVTKNGDIRLLLWHNTLLKDNDGGILGSLSSAQDITERKQAEEALRESYARHSAMIENIGDVIGIVGADGMTKYQSPNIEKWFGWRPEDLIDTNGWDMMHPDDVERIQKEFSELLKKESTSTVEYRFKCKDGIYKWIELTAINRISDPAINGVLLNYHDITERKQAEETLKNSEGKYRSILDNTQNAIFIKDLNGKYIYVNKTFENLHGIKNEKIMGLTDHDIFPEKLADKFRGNDLIVINSGKPTSLEESVPVNGKVQSVISTKFLLYDESKNKYATCGIAIDITERKQAEAEIQKLNNELEERVALRTSELTEANKKLSKQADDLEEVNRLKSAFLTNMSHELRTPLNSVISLSGVLDTQLAPVIPDEEHGFIKVIKRNGEHLLGLINDILDLSRIEAGKEVLTISDFQVSTVIAEIMESIQPLAAENGIDLIDEIQPDLNPIHSDAIKCHHILLNLIANAVKFTKEGRVTVSTRQTKENIFVSVADTGVGISDEQLPYIFDAFRQANESTTREFEGTGLGLAIAFEYTKLLSGDLTVESVLGEGSVFTLRLPTVLKVTDQALDVNEAALQRKSPQIRPNKRTKKPLILIVEDNSDNLIAMKAMLKSNYETLEAHDGKEGLQQARDNTPDVILMDALMPVMDGKEALRELRNDETLGHIPVIVVTASAMTGDKEALLALGFDAYISKPIDSGLLIQAIESVLG